MNESHLEVNCLLENIVERTQDFTDSAYTSHDHRQGILLLSDRQCCHE